MMDDPLDDFKMSLWLLRNLCDKSEGLSQLYEFSIVESVDLFKAKIPHLLFRPRPQQEVKSNVWFWAEECCLLVARLRYEQ